MEESNLLKKRLQAITEKHRIQEDIRHKKLGLDEMKLRLQHMKKKTLRDQWLQQDSAQQQLLLQDQQQTKALQLSIYRTELEVASLEREESMILTDESFILNRLKAVEKRPEDIIKEVLSRLSPDLLQVHNVTTHVPDVRGLPGDKHSDPSTPSRTPFDMMISSAPPEELNPLTGLEDSDGGRRNLHAFHNQQWSRDYRCASDLSTSELEQLVRCAAGQSQVQLQLHQNPFRNNEDGFNKHQEDRGNQREHYEVCVVKSIAEIKVHDPWDKYQGKAQDEHYCSFTVEDQHPHMYCKSRECCAPGDEAAVFQANSRIKGHNGKNQHKSCSLLPPTPHEQDAVPVATYSSPPLKDDINVEKEDRHCCRSTFYHFNIETASDHEHCSSLYGEPRTASPLYVEDRPYTILHTLESPDPVTAVFMGLQAKQDNSEGAQECLRAELVIIRDDHSEDTNESKNSENENRVQSGSREKGLERQGKHTSTRKLSKKQKSCCSVC